MESVNIEQVNGARCFDNDTHAKMVAGELSALEESRGGLNPELLVEYAASHPDSELHSCFEWNDSVAATKHRITQAAYILRSVAIVRKDDPRGTQVRMFVNIERTEDSPSKYVNTQKAMADEEMREIVLGRVEHELKSIRRKHRDLHELATVWSSIDRLESVA